MVYFIYILSIIVGYLIGSIPFAFVLVKIFHNQDIRQVGSGNVGATNVWRAGFKGLAVATFVLDAGKALIAIFLITQFSIIFISDPADYLRNLNNICLTAGFFAIIGHLYPIFLKFKGGKGVSTMIGYFLYISFWMIIFGVISWFITIKLTKYSSLSSLVAALTMLIYALIGVPMYAKVAVLLVVIIVFYKHKDNIIRLIKREEKQII
jgi:glycerol-3-phosphate acyltransferase PlsY